MTNLNGNRLYTAALIKDIIFMRVGVLSRILRNCELKRLLCFQLNNALAVTNKLYSVDFQRSKVIPVFFFSKLFLCFSEVGQVLGRGSYGAASGPQVRAGADELQTATAVPEARQKI